MYRLSLGRKAAPAANVRRRPSHRREFVDPALGAQVDPLSTETGAAAVTGVSDVSVVEPVRKRYRAVIIRNRVERAVVEFDADETADLYAVAEELIPQIPPESWTVDPTTEYGYLDRVEEAEAVLTDVEEVGDAVEGPATTLSRRARLRRSRGRKMAAVDVAAELDALRAEAEALAAAPIDATVIEGLYAVSDRLAAVAVDPIADGATDDGTVAAAQEAIAAFDTWLAETIASAEAALSTDTVAEAPAATLARRRSLRSRRRKSVEVGQQTLGDYSLQAEELAAAGDADGLAGLSEGVASLIASVALTNADGLEVPGAQTLVDDATALQAAIAEQLAALASSEAVPEVVPEAVLARRRAA